MARQPEPWPSFIRRFKDLEQQVTRILNASPFTGTGMSIPAPGVVQVDGELDVNGPIDVHGAANFDGNTTIGGNAAITGTLSLPAGIINNDALANPVVPQSVWKGTTSNFGLAVSWSTLVSQALTVPSGVNSAQVIGFVRLVATNTTASKDYLYSDFDIAGQSSGGFATPVDPGDPGTSFCSFARTLTGLTPGGTVTLTASGSTGFASWASTNNVCQISASVTWYR